jgi:hypothetical protein
MSNGQRCFFTHGKSADVIKTSQAYSMNYSFKGHYHTKFYNFHIGPNPDNIFWAMNVGCLINQRIYGV